MLALKVSAPVFDQVFEFFLFVGIGIFQDLDRFRVLQVPGLPEAEAQNLFDEFSDFRTNADIEAIRLAFVAMRAGSWKGPNDETDLFYMLDAMLAKAMTNPVTPL